ncbi:hypothetical protein [uncultured Arcticibacterium sp.]|uniref:hypothetical protein n=1 Tax=uncultured Arcticibacterium sp. TaxID=2173042 RepID=UPI0030FC4AD5
MKKIIYFSFLILLSSSLFAQSVLVEPTGITPAPGGGDSVSDADGNTKVEVEKTSDEDKIRFTASGKEIAVLDSQTLHLAAPGNSVFIGLDAGRIDEGTHSLLANDNVGVGTRVLYYNTSGYHNTALGNEALNNNSIGYANSALGRRSLFSNTTGSSNSAMGWGALVNNTTGYSNSAFGRTALSSITTGYNNSAFGFQALSRNTKGIKNVAFGVQAGATDTLGNHNVYIGHATGGDYLSPMTNRSGSVFVGYQAGFHETESDKLYIENSDSDEPLIYGDFDQDQLKVNGIFAVRDESRLRGYTTLGDDALTPSIKMKKLVGSFTSSSGGGSSYIAHGLADADRILSVDVAVNVSSNVWIPENFTNTADREYNFYYNDAEVVIANKSGNSSEILNKAVRILITYEE